MPSTKPRITFVTDQWIIEEMKIIAEEHGRSMSKEIEMLCKEHIKKYHSENDTTNSSNNL